MKNIQKNISHDRLIKKFSYYGLLKNLRFFEPYLLIFLLNNGISYIQIGTLIAIREIIVYVFEIPSGVLADRYGRKNELMLCFIFYIISFILFFLKAGFPFYIAAMIFYGFGEAFRSGTHKAMIMQYLQKKDWFAYKSLVYGRTRSYSLIGSAISSIISIFIIFVLPDLRWVFLISILPYSFDFLLIMSYPDYLNQRKAVAFEFKDFLKQNVLSVKYAFSGNKMRTLILNSAFYQGTFKTIKDYIQPFLISMAVVQIGISIIDKNISNIYLGLFYFIVNLFNAAAARNSYRLVKNSNEAKIINILFLVLSVSGILIGFFGKLDWNFMIILLFMIINAITNIRRPIMVGVLTEQIDKDQRASILSVESQITSIFTAGFSFLIGVLATTFGLNEAFLILSSIFFVGQFLVRL
ncbi:MAG: MFS transporter [Anaerolineaceae bacterium]|nr:MFS transporter [Anaerolineaceae bacterium]